MWVVTSEPSISCILCSTGIQCMTSSALLLQVWYLLLRFREEFDMETVSIGPVKGTVYESKNGYLCKADLGIEDITVEVWYEACLITYSLAVDEPFSTSPKPLEMRLQLYLPNYISLVNYDLNYIPDLKWLRSWKQKQLWTVRFRKAPLPLFQFRIWITWSSLAHESSEEQDSAAVSMNINCQNKQRTGEDSPQ